jgi:hypothetical protein
VCDFYFEIVNHLDNQVRGQQWGKQLDMQIGWKFEGSFCTDDVGKINRRELAMKIFALFGVSLTPII